MKRPVSPAATRTQSSRPRARPASARAPAIWSAQACQSERDLAQETLGLVAHAVELAGTPG